jgi:hypothetical protein
MALLSRKAEWRVIKIHRQPMSDELRARYEQQVLAPGQKWLETHPVTEGSDKRTFKGQRLPSYWRKIKPDLAKAFHLRCAYTAMCIQYNGEVDHAVSIDEDRTRAYEWDNFRYCVGWFNSKKQNVRSHQILDPMLVEDDWFEITWPDLQLRVTDRCPEHLRPRAEFMLEELGLRNGDTVMRNREFYFEQFEKDGEAALPFIEKEAPLIGRAIRKELARRASVSSAHK